MVFYLQAAAASAQEIDGQCKKHNTFSLCRLKEVDSINFNLLLFHSKDINLTSLSAKWRGVAGGSRAAGNRISLE